MNADMMRMMEDKGIAGAFVFAWTDEWFKRTWNTEEHQDPERRQLWHDPLTNEQWFGLVATDPEPVADAAVEMIAEDRRLRVPLRLGRRVLRPPRREAARRRCPRSWSSTPTCVPGPEQGRLPGHRRPRGGRRRRAAASTYVVPSTRSASTPATRPYHPDAAEDWHLYRLITNREFPHDGVTTTRRSSRTSAT